MLKTTKVAADRAHDQTKTVLPAEVARGVYMQNAPSLKALKLMHLMIATAGGRVAEPVQHEMRLWAFWKRQPFLATLYGSWQKPHLPNLLC